MQTSPEAGPDQGPAVGDEQAALRRVATLVARAAPPTEVFAAVAEEVGRLLQADGTFIARYQPDRTRTVVAAWNVSGETIPAGSRGPVVDGGVIANAEAQAALQASRARIVAAADATRRRIERDLHDGAQQRLVSLILQLRAARTAAPPGPGELGAELDQIIGGLTGVLDELRDFARGIHPVILADGGLGPALRTLARENPIPVDLGLDTPGRLPEPVEVCAYYVVSEALTNAAKHSRASAITVQVAAAKDMLRIRVRDDRAGGADFGTGTGLVGLKDRVEALGGQFALRSTPGAGTCITARLPLATEERHSRSRAR